MIFTIKKYTGVIGSKNLNRIGSIIAVFRGIKFFGKVTMKFVGSIIFVVFSVFISFGVASADESACKSFVSQGNAQVNLTDVNSSHVILGGKTAEDLDGFDEFTNMTFEGCIDLEEVEASCKREDGNITMSFILNPAQSCEKMTNIRCESWNVLFADITLMAGLLSRSCPTLNLSKLTKIEVSDGTNTQSIEKCADPEFSDHFVFSCPEEVDSGKSKWQKAKERFWNFINKYL